MPSLIELKKEATKHKINLLSSRRKPSRRKPMRKPSRRKPMRKPSRRKPSRKPSRRKPSRKPSRRKPIPHRTSRSKISRSTKIHSNNRNSRIRSRVPRRQKICKYGRDPISGKCNKKPYVSIKNRGKISNIKILRRKALFTPGKELTIKEVQEVQEDIYNQIIHDVKITQSFQPLQDVLSESGNIETLLPFLEIMTQFDIQLMIGKTEKEYNNLIKIINLDLESYIKESHKILQEYIKQMLKRAPEIIHKKGSHFAEDIITWKTWNNMGYTQLASKKLPSGRRKSIDGNHWSCMDDCKFNYKNHGLHGKYPFDKLTMNDIANFDIKNSKNEVLLFHGTSGTSIKSLIKSVDWKRGDGFLGQGFYLTFNPNEAKIYACRSANETNSNGVVLEIVLKNSNTLTQHNNNKWFNGDGEFVRNTRNDEGGWYDQISIRDKGVREMIIKRIHIFPRKALKHHSEDKNPRSSGQYTVLSKSGHYCL